jgi:hypothetical protein
MYQYRQVIHRMRMGETDRSIARSKLMGRLKCAQIRAVAEQNGWLEDTALPDDQALAAMFKKREANITHDSRCQPYEKQIAKWFEAGIQGTTIHRALVEQFGFAGSYSSVRRLLQKLQKEKPDVSCMLDFAPAEAAQVDFGKGPTIIDVFTGEVISTWLGCHRRAFEFFNGIPDKLIIDYVPRNIIDVMCPSRICGLHEVSLIEKRNQIL